MPEIKKKTDFLAGSGIQKLQDLAELMYQGSEDDLGLGPSAMGVAVRGAAAPRFARALKTTLETLAESKGIPLHELSLVDLAKAYLGLRFPTMAKGTGILDAVETTLPKGIWGMAPPEKILIDPKKFTTIKETINVLQHEGSHKRDISQLTKGGNFSRFDPSEYIQEGTQIGPYTGRYIPGGVPETYTAYRQQPVEKRAHMLGDLAGKDFVDFYKRLDDLNAKRHPINEFGDLLNSIWEIENKK
jgi:hypothetical protein